MPDTPNAPKPFVWRLIEGDGPDGAGGQVWVAYPNPYHPDGWNLRVQWTPIQSEHNMEPIWWIPVVWPGYPPSER